MAVLQTDIDRITLALRSALSGSGIDAGIGSVVDGLLTVPASSALASILADTDSVATLVRLSDIADGAAVDNDDLDSLVAAFGVTRRGNIPASGSIDLIMGSANQLTLPSGARFRATATNTSYVTESSIQLVPITAGGVETATRIFIRPFVNVGSSTRTYRARIPVVAAASGPRSILIAGDELVPQASLAGIAQIVAAETFVGGTLAETNSQLARRVIEGMVSPGLYSGRAVQQLSESIVEGSSVGVVGPNSSINTRMSNNLFGVTPAGYADLYTDTGSVTRLVLPVDISVVDAPTRQGTVTISPEDAVGVYRMRVIAFSATPLAGPVDGEIATGAPTYAAAPFAGVTPNVGTSSDLAYSPNVSLTVSFQDTREVSGTPVNTWVGPQVSGEYAVELEVSPRFRELAEALYDPANRPAGADVLVRAGIPVNVSLSVGVRVQLGSRSAEDIRSLVAAAVTRLPIGTDALNAFTLGAAIRAFDPTVEVVSLTASGTALLPANQTYTIVQSGAELRIPIVPAVRLSPQSAFFNLQSRSDVEVTIVS